MKKEQGGYIDFICYDTLLNIINQIQDYVIQGVCLLQVLKRANISIDSLVYVKRYHLGKWAEERELELKEPIESFLAEEHNLNCYV